MIRTPPAFLALVMMGGLSAGQETAPAPGDEKKDPLPTREIVIVGAASPLQPADVFDTPYSAENVGAGRIANESLFRTVPDIFREIAGASAQKTSPGHGGSPYLRGFTGHRNLLLVDGIRFNNSLFRDGPNQYWNTLDPFVIDRLDVLRGPSSVLYGSDSIGGTVYAYTREPSFPDGGTHVRGRSYGRYASAEDSYTARQEVTGNAGDFGWLAGVTYKDFNDITGGRGIGLMPGTGYDEYDGDAKLVLRTGEKSKLVLAFQHVRQDDVPRTHRTTLSRPWHGTVAGASLAEDYDQARDLVYLQYHATCEGGVIDALKAGVSYSWADESMNRLTANTGATQTKREVREASIRIPGAWVQAARKTGAGFFTAGAECYREDVGSAGHNWLVNGTPVWFDRGEVADDVLYTTMGAFLQDEFPLGPVDITPGVRCSRIRVEADTVDPNLSDAVPFAPLDESYQAVTGGLRAVCHVDADWNIIAGWGMGFRAPTLDDTTAIKLVMSGTIDLPSEDLDPERSQTFDLGVRGRGGRWEAGAFAFYTILDDYIRRVPAGTYEGFTARTKQNFGGGRVWGYEVSGLVHVTDDWSVRADAGYAQGEAEDLVNGEKEMMPLSKQNPLIGHVVVRWEPPKSSLWAEGILTAANHQKRLSQDDETDPQRIPPGGTPGYAVFGLRGGCRVSENLNATLAIDNLTDRDYRIHGSGQNEPGTNVVMAVDITY